VADADVALTSGPTATISGEAFDAAGRPLAGRSVGLALEGRRPYQQQGFAFAQSIASAVVAPDGTFIIRNVPPGEYTMRANTAPGVQPATPPETASVPLVVNGDIEGIRIVTSAGWSMSGQVVMADGTVPRSREGIRVAMRPLSGVGSPGQGPAEIKDDWSFSLANIMAAARLSVTLPDGLALSAVLDDGRDIADAVLERKSGETLENVRIVLTDRGTTLSGQIVDDKNAPYTGGTIVVFADDRDNWVEGSRYVRAVRPDQQAQYRVQGLPPGAYLAVALEYVEDGIWNDPDYLDSIRPQAQKFVLNEAESRILALQIVTP
jgi:hypothetical protein